MNPYNQESNDGVIVSEHKIVPASFYRRIGIVFLGFALLIGLSWAAIYYIVAPQQLEAELERQSNAEIAALIASDSGVLFEMVSQALNSEMLNPIPEQSVDMLRSDYVTAQDMVPLDSNNKPFKEDVWAISVNGATYANVINSLSLTSQLTLSQMHDEIREVAYQKGELYKIDALVTRIGDNGSLLYPELANPRVGKDAVFYPSPFTLEVYFVTGLLTRVLPDQAQYYEQRGEEIAMAGVAYGHYSIAEKDAMKEYVAWYLNEAEANPNFQTLITNIQSVANQNVQ